MSTHKPMAGLSILLGEDNPDAAFLMRTILRTAGARCDLAKNGLAAVELAAARDYDMILLDLHQPVLDGYGAARALRKAGYDGPLIAYTACCVDSSRTLAWQAGFDLYLEKTIGAPALVSALTELWQRRPLYGCGALLKAAR